MPADPRSVLPVTALILLALSASSSPSRAGEAAKKLEDLRRRVDAARAAASLDVPHRLVAQVQVPGPDGAPVVATAAEVWWSPKTLRKECRGSQQGNHVQAIDDGVGWTSGQRTSEGTQLLDTALGPLRAPCAPGAKWKAETDGTKECLTWLEGEARRPARTCIAGGAVVLHEAGAARWDFSEHAPFGDKRVPRLVTMRRDDGSIATVRITELEAVASEPPDLLAGRPPDAEDLDTTCTMVAPVLKSGVKPDYPLVERQRGVGGLVILEGILDVTGTVTNAKVKQGSGSKLIDQAAQRAFEQRRYEPATCGGKPRAIYLKVRMSFDPEKE